MEQARQQRPKADQSMEPQGAGMAGPQQVRLSTMADQLNLGAGVQRLAAMRSSATSAVPSAGVLQRFVVDGKENGLAPIGVDMRWDAGQNEWVGMDGFRIDPQPVLFTMGVSTPLTKAESKRKAKEDRQKKASIRRKADDAKHAEYRRAKWDGGDKPEIPKHATPIEVNRYAMHEPITQREANDHKNQKLGITVELPGTRYRKGDLLNFPEELMPQLIDNSKWYMVKGAIWACNADFVAIFSTGDIATLERALMIRLMIFDEEAQPRSGAGRAAPDEDQGTERAPAQNEAEYHEPKGNLLHAEPAAAPTFKASHSGNQIEATITHKGPWAKGVRDPGQSAVMGSQSAKNYMVDQLEPNRANRRGFKETLPGRWEWLHLIGSSLGGPNTAYNLVAGSYDANTKMIALEHRVANWGAVSYQGDFKPSQTNPISIKTVARVKPTNTHVGDDITMTVSYGNNEVVKGNYKADEQQVITKSEYKAEESRVDGEINAPRQSRKS